MSKVDRTVIADGDCYLVECAVHADGTTSPVKQLLESLRAGMWEDPEADALPDEYQPKLYHRLLARFEYFANHGEFESRRLRNFLNDGIWEYKDTNLRVTFYDCDGHGSWSAKNPRVRTLTNDWELPDLDEFVRLGHYFAKTSEKTAQEDIRAAQATREVDVNHDS